MSLPEVLAPHLCVLHYTEDYDLDTLLKHGAGSPASLALHALRTKELRSFTLPSGFPHFSCTSFHACTPAGSQILSHNYDTVPGSTVVVYTDPDSGYKSMALLRCDDTTADATDEKQQRKFRLAPFFCVSGINEMGVAVTLLSTESRPTRQSGRKKQLFPSLALRAILDTCATIEDALSLLDRYALQDISHDACHFHLTDPTGDSVIVEYVKNRMEIIRQEGPFQCSSGFFITEDGDNRHAEGCDRVQKLTESLTPANGKLTALSAIELLVRCRVFAADKNQLPIRTQWSAVFDCRQKTLMLLADGRERKVWELHPDGRYRTLNSMPGSEEICRKVQSGALYHRNSVVE